MPAEYSRVALITGAGRGIGRAIALRLSADGFHIVAADKDGISAKETSELCIKNGRSAEAAAVDVTERSAVFELVTDLHQRLGRMDALVNNAMWVRYAPLAEFEEEQLDGMIAIGVKATYWAMQAVIPIMQEQKSGAIVNITSPAAVRSVPGSSAYALVKGAVSSLTLQAAGELGSTGIRVNGLMPGSVPTPGASAVVDEAGYNLRLSRTPIGRLGQPKDIANGVSFLVSPDAAFVTGHILAVDGGFLVT